MAVLGRSIAALALQCLVLLSAQASKEPWEEFEKIVGGAKEVSPHGNNTFGDAINLQTGALSFRTTDVSIRGNNALSVEVTRTFTTKTKSGANRGSQGSGPNLLDAPLGDWEIDLPYVGGVFANATGWVNRTAGAAGQRCSVANPSLARPPGVAMGQQFFQDIEIWQGTRINIPGRGSRPLLVRTQSLPQPDGPTAYWITSDWTSVSCLPSIVNGSGEGFLATDADGKKYWFNWLAVSAEQRLAKKHPLRNGSPPYYFLDRGRYALYATRVEDRFGNWVQYSYSNAASGPVRVDRIESSDGRLITLSYAGGRLSNVNAHGRTWSYAYSAAGSLTSVTLPDNSAWSISLPDFQNLLIKYVRPPNGAPTENDPYRSCIDPGELIPQTYIGVVQHPSGAAATFVVSPQRFYKDGINFGTNCTTNNPNTTNDDEPYFPMAWDSYATASKQVTGPALAAATWQYTYGAGRFTEVQGPNDFARYTYGNLFRNNEGKLLKVERGASSSQILEVQTLSYELAQTGTPFLATLGSSGHSKTPEWSEAYTRPEKQSVYTRQGVNFSRAVVSFDSFARPATVTRSSTVSGSPSKTESVEYHDNVSRWILGQVARVTEGGIVRQQSEFHPTTAMLTAQYDFGLLVESRSYHPDGSVFQRKDPLGRADTFQDYWRGIPRHVTLRDGAVQTADVDNLGLVTRHTNAAGTTTHYGYDAMGRLASIVYPPESWGTYAPTTIAFERIDSVSYGIPAGHWRQTITTGNARISRYYDTMWREGLTHIRDLTNEAGTSQFVVRRYNTDGRKIFESQPQRSIASIGDSVPGKMWWYDALGRTIAQREDSELGPLDTVTEYWNGFQRHTTDPRGFRSTQGFLAFDKPTEEWLTYDVREISHGTGENAITVINRDIFGKATSIVRSGGGKSVTRSYVYDGYQRLCKTIEPETGATVQVYDAAGQVAWRASGLNLGSGSCDQGGVPEGSKVSFGYDARGKLTNTWFADGSQNYTRSYTADGLLQQVVAWGGGGNTITWNYGYNNRRILTTEQYTWGDPNNGWTFTHSIDQHGHISGLTDRWGSMWYSPNALGQPTQVSGYASGVTYHPNGAVAGYTLTNGVVFSMSQYIRGLPAWWTHTGVSNDLYQHDAKGNVAAIWDYQGGGSNNRSMGYDGLDRLTVANGPWGGGNFAYDALDNIVASNVGARSLVHQYDASNRLVGLTGSQTVGIGYDAQGNLTTRGGQGFSFDIGNRLRTAHGKGTYFYDGHGRRNLVWHGTPGDYMHQAYTQDGKLRMGWRSTEGHRRHVYLGDKLIAETTEGWNTAYFHTDALGSPIAKTNSAGGVVHRTRYEPYGATVAGSTNPTNIGFTGHVNDVDTGLVYMQQRYYDPIAGRFLSVDPVTTSAEDGSSFNRYVYGENNPYRYTDPDGRQSKDNGKEIGRYIRALIDNKGDHKKAMEQVKQTNEVERKVLAGAADLTAIGTAKTAGEIVHKVVTGDAGAEAKVVGAGAGEVAAMATEGALKGKVGSTAAEAAGAVVGKVVGDVTESTVNKSKVGNSAGLSKKPVVEQKPMKDK